MKWEFNSTHTHTHTHGHTHGHTHVVHNMSIIIFWNQGASKRSCSLQRQFTWGRLQPRAYLRKIFYCCTFNVRKKEESGLDIYLECLNFNCLKSETSTPISCSNGRFRLLICDFKVRWTNKNSFKQSSMWKTWTKQFFVVNFIKLECTA